jgi:predicted ATPase
VGPSFATNRFVITGAPGVGKSTLLSALERHSIICVPEPARIVLAEQRALKSEALPEKNSKLFCEKLLERSIENYRFNRPNHELVIFDRGIPDNIAYATCFGLDTEPYFEASQRFPYSRQVFLLAPWEEIYVTDEERKMTFKEVCEFHQSILKAYARLGYEAIEVPRSSPNEHTTPTKTQNLSFAATKPQHAPESTNKK